MTTFIRDPLTSQSRKIAIKSIFIGTAHLKEFTHITPVCPSYVGDATQLWAHYSTSGGISHTCNHSGSKSTTQLSRSLLIPQTFRRPNTCFITHLYHTRHIRNPSHSTSLMPQNNVYLSCVEVPLLPKLLTGYNVWNE